MEDRVTVDLREGISCNSRGYSGLERVSVAIEVCYSGRKKGYRCNSRGYSGKRKSYNCNSGFTLVTKRGLQMQ